MPEGIGPSAEEMGLSKKDTEVKTPNPDDDLTDAEFTRKHGSAFGRDPIPGIQNQEIDPIWARSEQIRQAGNAEGARNSFDEDGNFIPSSAKGSSELPPREFQRNLDGQYVDPNTKEPIRRGSPEWQELARQNKLPRNQ
jgi:hypothetical protein